MPEPFDAERALAALDPDGDMYSQHVSAPKEPGAHKLLARSSIRIHGHEIFESRHRLNRQRRALRAKMPRICHDCYRPFRRRGAGIYCRPCIDLRKGGDPHA